MKSYILVVLSVISAGKYLKSFYNHSDTLTDPSAVKSWLTGVGKRWEQIFQVLSEVIDFSRSD